MTRRRIWWAVALVHSRPPLSRSATAACRARTSPVYEVLPVLGGSLDGAGNPEDGYSMRGGRVIFAAPEEIAKMIEARC